MFCNSLQSLGKMPSVRPTRMGDGGYGVVQYVDNPRPSHAYGGWRQYMAIFTRVLESVPRVWGMEGADLNTVRELLGSVPRVRGME